MPVKMTGLEASIRRPVAFSGKVCVPRAVPVIRLRTFHKFGSTKTDGPPAITSEPPVPPQPASKSTADIAKEALLQTIKSETTTAKDVLGEDTLRSLRQLMGEERAGAFIGALDGLLANRRLATLVFAVADVALIFVLIKVFRSTVMHE